MNKYRFYKTLWVLCLISEKKFHELTPKYTKEYRAVARSKLFDKRYYLDQHPDVKELNLDPVEHYVTTGWKSDKINTPFMDEKQYLAMYPDVKDAGLPPIAHWELYGKKEDRYAEISKNIKQSRSSSSFKERIHAILNYPITVYEECQRLEAEIKQLEGK